MAFPRHAVISPNPMRVGVLDISQNPLNTPRRFVSKNAAKALVRRLLAVHITKHLIQMVEVKRVSTGPIAPAQPRPRTTYEHHIEPKLHTFTMADNDWMAYLYGWQSSESNPA